MIFTSDYSIKMPFGQAILSSLLGIITVMFILAVIAILIMLISKAVRTLEGKIESSSSNEKHNSLEQIRSVPLPKTQSQGQLELTNVDEETAAIIMAIVSNQSGIPLNRLCFKSIKLSEENMR